VALADAHRVIPVATISKEHRFPWLPRLAFQALLTGGFLALLLWRVDVGEAIAVLRGVNVRWLALAVFVYSLSKLVHAYRWRLMLYRHSDLPLGGLFGLYLVSNAANTILPRSGDLVRIQVASHRYAIPWGEVAGTVLAVESLLDGVAFVALLAVALMFLDVPFFSAPLFGALAGGTALGLSLAMLAARLGEGDVAAFVRRLAVLPRVVRRPLLRFAPDFVRGLALLRSPSIGAGAVIVSLVAWLIEAAMFWFLGQAFGLHVSLGAYLLLLIGANLAVALPLTPGNIGPYELAVVELLTMLEAAPAQAAAFAFGSHALMIMWIYLSGIAALWALRLGPSELVKVDRGSSDPRPLPWGGTTRSGDTVASALRGYE